MNILIIPSWHPTPERPFWANWILPYIKALRDAGHDVFVIQVDVISDEVSDNEKSIKYLNDNHLYVPLKIKKTRYYRTRFFYGNVLRKYTEKLFEAYRIAEKKWGRADVIHAHVSLPAGYGAAQLGEKENIPVIVSEHYSGFESDARFWWRVGGFVKEMGKKIQGFYTVSPGFAERIEKTKLIRVTGIIPNPIVTDFFSPIKTKVVSHAFEIVTTGNLGLLKGTDILFEALSILIGKVNWKLTYFGNVQKKTEFSKWLDNPEFKKRVTFSGIVSQEELVRIYSLSDLFVVSSRSETANVSMLQAMACGLPVVTTRCGGPETLIDDTVGISVPVGDSKAMSQAILKIAANQKKFTSENNRNFVLQNYSMQVIVKNMLAAYRLGINNTK